MGTSHTWFCSGWSDPGEHWSAQQEAERGRARAPGLYILPGLESDQLGPNPLPLELSAFEPESESIYLSIEIDPNLNPYMSSKNEF